MFLIVNKRDYDECECGNFKTKRSKQCQPCAGARGGKNQTRVGSLDWHGGDRYCIVGVSGFPSALGSGQGNYGTTFSVLDLNDDAHEVKRVRARGKFVRIRRAQLILWIKEREWAERMAA